MPSAKPVLHPLKTPKLTTKFPSELHNESSSSLSDGVKQEDGISTPITPPAAYTEFLKAFTPVFSSPASAGVSFPKFPFDRPAHSPTSQPSSAVSGSFVFNDPVRSATASLPPPTPFTAPASQASQPRRDPTPLRRLRIPQPLRYSPTTESPQSATTIRSPFSPSDWKLRYFEAPRSASGRVSVKHVVTRTVTYKRTQLEAPPKGKRRKCQEDKET
ncbi:hypothetical protein KXW98_008916 [Aspergillus fumigatus]|nr:hypothetical protein CNMCM8057_008252 [Aspergillus fumigatus]KAF4291527.1 hypothetical protein CNMCM8686_008685 [Aspergillus fumigatus]KAH1328483.1 hypothetical protein KXX47_007896 [Aspergillus fumigatus]KAH1339686.1 hypothetical protein KXX14_006908 [Aspergillus fumigatus]KAH1378782.1 hypothetical protein KXX10_008890 [Aspergillus fumigatus]